MNSQRLAAPYFVLQGSAVLLWWLLLWQVPFTRQYFLPPHAPEWLLLVFALPDIALAGLGSFAAAALLWRAHTFAAAAVWIVAGALNYATLYCLGLSWLTDATWLSTLMMLPAAALSTMFAALTTRPGTAFFRRAVTATPRWNVAKTIGQIIVFWSVFLYVLPALLQRVAMELGLPGFQFSSQRATAVMLFIGCSLLGLWSGMTMAWLGGGTPLPIDGTNQIVVRGPYAYIRNPMVIAGLGQGTAVGILVGSWLVLLYVFVGGVLWNVIARPLEEQELHQKFGASYQRYCADVKCWFPRLAPVAGEIVRQQNTDE